MAPRRRLDTELVRRSLAPSREAARRLVEEGRVLVSGAPATKAARQVDPGEDIRIDAGPPRFVSRAGEKLAGALERFGIDSTGRHCLDIGSSTGGFTHCLLQAGAASVLAVDVGTHQLHERLRADPRVKVREQTDIRSVTPAQLAHPISLAVGDVSFISLRLVLPALAELDPHESLLLIKPQFEAGREEAARGHGVITDPAIWRRILTTVLEEASSLDFACAGVMVSPITGRAGNVEFVTHLTRTGSTTTSAELERLIDAAVADAGGEIESS